MATLGTVYPEYGSPVTKKSFDFGAIEECRARLRRGADPTVMACLKMTTILGCCGPVRLMFECYDRLPTAASPVTPLFEVGASIRSQGAQMEYSASGCIKPELGACGRVMLPSQKMLVRTDLSGSCCVCQEQRRFVVRDSGEGVVGSYYPAGKACSLSHRMADSRGMPAGLIESLSCCLPSLGPVSYRIVNELYTGSLGSLTVDPQSFRMNKQWLRHFGRVREEFEHSPVLTLQFPPHQRAPERWTTLMTSLHILDLM